MSSETDSTPENQRIADRLREVSDLLEQQGANRFRVAAYRRAADTVVHLDRELRQVVAEEGLAGLVALPDVGQGIAAAIGEMLRTGRLSLLERLRGSVEPEELFRSIPGVGPKLARRIHDALEVDSLEGLEMAIHDGRIEAVPGIGRRRAAAMRAALESMLSQRLRPRRAESVDGPGVGVLLDVDREYRSKARLGELPKIAPRRFNPEHEAWLPVLHSERGGWHFTALYSNTGRAHRLGRTRDWVVLYFYDDHHRAGQQTVVTETRGPLAGRRVVRGREADCRDYYRGLPGS
jgi:putative hydrolase